MKISKNWLKARARNKQLIEKAKKVAAGGLLSAVIIGPFLYFGVIAMPVELRESQDAGGEITTELPAAPEIRNSESPIEFPEQKEIKKIKDPKVEFKLEDLSEKLKERELIPTSTTETPDIVLRQKLENEFDSQKIANIKIIKKQTDEDFDEKIFVIENLKINDGPRKVQNNDDAELVAIAAVRKYLQTLPNPKDYSVLKDTSNIKASRKTTQLVLSSKKTNNEKWYITFQQYNKGLPVFDGNIKMVFTEEKQLLTLSDNIKTKLPQLNEFAVSTSVAENNAKEVFEWDEASNDIEFTNKGYYKGKPAYQVEADVLNPVGNWKILVNGVTGEVEKIESNIRLQGSLPASPEPGLEIPASPEPETLSSIFSQVLGKIFPKTPNDTQVTEPFAHEYVNYDNTQYITDNQGFFENEDQDWYSVFLDGPFVTIHDDNATANADIKDTTPGNPFVWDTDSASLAAINAFYHTNKIRDYFADNHGYEMTHNIPLTVNSELVDTYMNGCGAWFNNELKTIEMGRGGSFTSCPDDLNYALSSDMVYHEYAHFVVEEITHLPNIYGAESAAMGEGLADYFAASINDDSLWGDIVAPNRTRDLNNNLNYQTDMIGESHNDGQILAGALWNLRTAIGQEETDRLIFNTLYQDRLHFETFMYGMIIEDDDNDDFSDGTPHLIAIITAFENHGIGPEVANFNGLPITPEAWALILEEQAPEGEEDPMQGSWTGGCSWVGSALTVNSGSPCYVYYTVSTVTTITVNNGGILYLGAYNGGNYTYGIVTASGNVTVNTGGTLNIGYTTTAYGRLTANAFVYNYGTINVGKNSADGYLTMPSSSTYHFYNYGTFNVGSGSSSASVGTFTSGTRVQNYQNAVVNFGNGTSTGSMTQSSYYLANWAGSTTNIYSGSNVQVVSLPVYENATYGDATVDVRSGGILTVNNNANIGVPQAEPTPDMLGGILKSAGTVTIGGILNIYSDGTVQIDAGTITAGTTSIDENVLGNNGTLTVNNTGTLNTTYLDVGDATYEGGTIYVNAGGTINVNSTSPTDSLEMYTDSFIYNYGTFDVDGGLEFVSGYTTQRFYNGDTASKAGTLTANNVLLNGSGYLFNYGIPSGSSNNSTMTTEADTKVYQGNYLYNYGIFTTETLDIGLAGSDIDGGRVNNYSELNVIDTGANAAQSYIGHFYNYWNAAATTDLNILGTLTVSGKSGFIGYFNSEDQKNATEPNEYAFIENLVVDNYGEVYNLGSTTGRTNLHIDNNLTIDGGTFMNSNYSNLSVDGTLILNSGTYNDSATGVPAALLENLTINGGTFSPDNGPVTVTSKTYITGSPTLAWGTGIAHETGSLELDGYSMSIPTNHTITNNPHACTGIDGATTCVLEVNGSIPTTLTVSDNEVIDGNIYIGPNGVLAITSGKSLNVSGDFEVEEGTVNVNGSLNVTGKTYLSNTSNFNAGSSTHTFGSLEMQNGATLNSYSGTFTFSNNHACSTGNCIIEIGTDSSVSDSILYLAGSLIVNGDGDVIFGTDSYLEITEGTIDINSTAGTTDVYGYIYMEIGSIDSSTDINIKNGGEVEFGDADETISTDGAFNLDNGGFVGFFGSDEFINSAAGGTIAAPLELNGFSNSVNLNGAIATITPTGSITLSAGDSFNANTGVIVEGALLNSNSISSIINVDGPLSVDGGTLTVNGPFGAATPKLEVLNGGTADFYYDGTYAFDSIDVQSPTSGTATSSVAFDTGSLYTTGTPHVCSSGGSCLVEVGTDTPLTTGSSTFTTNDNLTIAAATQYEIGDSGTLTVAAPATSTTIAGNLILDGKLDGGDITVTGDVSSGAGDSSNFWILANDFIVGAAGTIASDAVSDYENGLTSIAGSYGGEGYDEIGGTTYGETKMSHPLNYGDTGTAELGGGAVFIEATGNITIDGIVSANGGATSSNSGDGAGSGGSVMISHLIDTNDTTKTFTGSGYIRANGGNAAENDIPAGGGRIVIDSPLLDDPDTYDFLSSHVEAFGGDNAADGISGAPGTIVYLGDDNNPTGTLIADFGPSSSATDGAATYIPDLGDLIFDRVEVKNGAHLNFEAVTETTSPHVCYDFNGLISVPSSGWSNCNDYPDKPYPLYINTTTTTAASGLELEWDNTVIIDDFTPVFRTYNRNPDNVAATYAEIQVATDTTFTGAALKWDTTGAPINIGTVNAGSPMSSDIEYAGDPLSESVDYYVRIRLLTTSSPSTAGLWTHRDIGDYYKFQVEEPVIVYTCGWSGANLTVADTEICELNGTGLTADSITVASGGTLILGTTGTTALTSSGAVDIQGAVNVGITGDPTYDTTFATSILADLTVQGSGTLNVRANSTNTNSVTVDGDMYIYDSAAVTNAGTINIADDFSLGLFGGITSEQIPTFTNNSGGILDVDDGASGVISAYHKSTLTNNGTVNADYINLYGSDTVATDVAIINNFGDLDAIGISFGSLNSFYGGVFNNEDGGNVISSLHYSYGGHFNNTAEGQFTGASINMTGTSAHFARLTNANTALGAFYSGLTINMYDYSTINNSGSFEAGSLNTGLSIDSVIINTDSMTFNDNLIVGSNTFFDNDGTLVAEFASLLGNSTLDIDPNGSLEISGTGINSLWILEGGTVLANGLLTVEENIYIYNGGTLEINYTSSPNTAGNIEIQAPDSGTSTLDIGPGAVLDITGAHFDCAGGGVSDYCSIEIGYDPATSGNAILIIDGTLNVPDLVVSDPQIYVGSDGRGQINIGATGFFDVNEPDSTFNTHATTPNGLIIESGGVADFAMPVNLYGNTIIDGILNAGTILVDAPIILDGTLDAGTADGDSLIVSGTGSISSSIESSTNFLINTHDLTIQNSGRISSDTVSQINPGSVGSGSHGGEGEGRAGTNATYGLAKLDKLDAPLYGQAGAVNASTVDALGGGGVRIYATGTIDITGDGSTNTISADGAASTNDLGGAGAGGTVIIIHEPFENTDEFIGDINAKITANGGNSSTTGVPVGGGGRVLISSPLLDDPDDGYGFSIANIEALGGHNDFDNNYAAAGTIVYTGDANSSNGTLIVDQKDGPATSSEKTEIPDPSNESGIAADWTFDRTQAKNGANITFDSTGTAPNPLVCYTTGTSSSVSNITCNAYPDKPNTLFVGETGQTGSEPTYGGSLTINDLTPEFSVIHDNPQDLAENATHVAIQVADNPEFSNSGGAGNTVLWDATNIPSTSPSTPGRTTNVEYAGAPLTVGTTYYVRMATIDIGGQGLWTRDDYYTFQVTNYACNWSDGEGSILIVNTGKTCIITGETQSATQITVDTGATLIVGDGVIPTTLTYSETINNYGIIQIGVTGDPAISSILTTAATSAPLYVRNGAELNIIENNNAVHALDSASMLYIASIGAGTVTNNAQVNVAGVAMYTEALLTNNGTFETTSTGTSITTYDSGSYNINIINNGTLIAHNTTGGDLDLGPDLHINNSGTFEIVGSNVNLLLRGSILNTGIINASEDIDMSISSTITNSGSGDINAQNLTTSTVGSNIQIDLTGGTIDITGITYIYGDTNIFNISGGTLTTNMLWIGYLSNVGGTVNISGTGAVNIGSGIISQGTLNITSTANPALNSTNALTLVGDGTKDGILNNEGIVSVDSLDIQANGILNNKDGANFNVVTDAITSDNGELLNENISTPGTFNANILSIRNSSLVSNDGILNITKTMELGKATGDNPTLNNNSSGTINIGSAVTELSLSVNYLSTFNNSGVVDIYNKFLLGLTAGIPAEQSPTFTNNSGGTVTNSTGASSGVEMRHNANLDNNGAFTSTNIDVNDAADLYNSGSGSLLINGVDGDLNINSGTVTAAGLLTVADTIYVENGGSVAISYPTSDNSAGSLEIQSPASGSSTANIGAATTLNLTGSHLCGLSDCSIEVGSDDFAGNSELTINGTLNILDSASNANVEIGSTGNGKILVANGGVFDVDEILGKFNTHATAPNGFIVEDGGFADFEMPANIYGNAYINSIFNSYGVLWIRPNSSMHIGFSGFAFVNGSTILVDAPMILDGTLDAGTDDGDNIIISGTGSISSSIGSSTNFLINTHDLTIEDGGNISSDAVSQINPGSVGAGSHGGEGEGRAGTNATYGLAKLDETDAPLYGQAGAVDISTVDALGGGGVRIYATGTIDITGDSLTSTNTISADGAASTNALGGAGAGGTVIIVHKPYENTDTFIGDINAKITANGGNSSTTDVPVGGGGRVLISSPLLDDPDDGYSFLLENIEALGGYNSSADNDYAAAGTIVYAGDANSSNGTLIVDQKDGLATSSEKTEIPDPSGETGGIAADWTFDRTQAKNGANITFDSSGTAPDPLVCYTTGTSSSVSNIACNAYPDKPNTMHIGETGEVGVEPSYDSILTLDDHTPAFSVIHDNPQDLAENATHVAIQVADNPAFSNTGGPGNTVLWDDVIISTSPSTPGRTTNIEYAGAALAIETPYYVKMATVDSGGQGLWTRDDYYIFRVTAFPIDPDCIWSGSSLTVNAGDTCTMLGNQSASSIDVAATGILNIGDGVIPTTITYSETITNNGIIQIGVAGDPAISSILTTVETTAPLYVRNGAELNIIENNNAVHTLDSASDLIIADTNTGTVTNSAQVSVQNLAMYAGALLTNNGTINISNSLDLSESAIININDGTVNTESLQVGADPAAGGTMNISGTGAVNVGNTGGEIYKGTINVTSTASPALNSTGTLNIAGDGVQDGILNNEGIATINSVNIDTDGVINNKDGASLSLTAVDNVLNLYNNAEFNNENISTPATFNTAGSIKMVDSSAINNDGLMYIDGYLEMGDTVGDNPAFNNSGTLDINIANIVNDLKVYYSSSFINTGIVDVYNSLYLGLSTGINAEQNSTLTNEVGGTIDVSGETNSMVEVVHNTNLVNHGTFNAYEIIAHFGENLAIDRPVIDNDGAITVEENFALGWTDGKGGIFNNETNGTLDITNTVGSPINITHGGTLNNIDGKITSAGNVYMEGDSIATDDLALINNDSAVANAFEINGLIEMNGFSEINNTGIITGEDFAAIVGTNNTVTNTATGDITFSGTTNIANDTVITNQDGANFTLTNTGIFNISDNAILNNENISTPATFNTAGSIKMVDSAAINNDGLMYIDGYLEMGDTAGDTPTFNNSGTLDINIANIVNDLKVYYSSSFINTGIVDVYNSLYLGLSTGINNEQNSTLTNEVGGTIDVSGETNSMVEVVHNANLVNHGTFNAYQMIAHFGENLAIDRPVIDNDGAITIEENFALGWTDGKGGIFNNTAGGTLDITNTVGSPLNITHGGVLNNIGGKITSAGNVYMEGDSIAIDDLALINNDSAVADALEINGVIEMGGFSEINNTGNITGEDLATIVDTYNNVVTNSTTGDITFSGTTNIANDAVITTDGAYTSTLGVSVNDTASFNIGATGSLLIDGIGGDLNVSTGTVIADGLITVEDKAYISDGGTLEINYTASDNSIGSIEIQSPASGDSTLDIGNGATLNLTGSHSDCVGINDCSVEVGSDVFAGNSILIIDGILNIEDTTDADIQINSEGNGQLTVSVTGELNVLETASSSYNFINDGTLTINNTTDLTIPLEVTGALIVDAFTTLNVTDSFIVTATGTVDQRDSSVVTVVGSSTVIDGDYELDGTLNAGDLTVNSGGHIHSGVGTSTNFLINADSLIVNSGGLIASDAVSTNAAATTGGGSYGGEGTNFGGGNTYGPVRFDETVAPLYGQQGRGASPDGEGGGGVRIVVTTANGGSGNITIDGIISANGAEAFGVLGAGGSGGTITLIHDIDHTDTSTTFTGTGSITANGGNASPTGGHIGGGGRIVIDSILYDYPDDPTSNAAYGFTGTVVALGGSSSGVSQAASGTVVLLGDLNNPRGTLIVDNDGTPPSGGTPAPETYIRVDGGQTVFSFDRVEARNEAVIAFESKPNIDPIACIINGNGSISAISNCASNPDKPESMYIYDAYTTPQSSDEPYNGNALVIPDFTPNFSVIYKNLDDSNPSASHILFEVATDENFTTKIWDATDTGNPVELTSPIYNGDGRTEAITYAGDALTPATTYYVRAAFSDVTGTTRGLWTHRDMDNYYQFEITEPFIITNSCASDTMQIEDVNHPGRNVQDADGQRFGSGSCTITVTSAISDWGIYYSFDPGAAFENSSHVITPIDNANTCDMDETGDTVNEIYGYNLTNVSTNLSPAIVTEIADCNEPFGSTLANYDKYFNVEESTSTDTILNSVGNSVDVVTAETFDINIYANIDSITAVATDADPYTLNSYLTAVGNP